MKHATHDHSSGEIAAGAGVARGNCCRPAQIAADIRSGTIHTCPIHAQVRQLGPGNCATVRNIRQNLSFAFGYNAVGIPVAAGVLYPFRGLLLSPIIAAVAMSLSSVSVLGNALRLRRSGA